MSEVQRLRMELKTDIELIAIRQGDMAQGMDRISASLEFQGQQIDEQGQQIAEQGQQIAAQGQQIAAQGQQIARLASELNRQHQETARQGREIAEGQRWTQGRMRLMGERFDALFGALEQESAGDHELLLDLRDRVERLEGNSRPPAA